MRTSANIAAHAQRRCMQLSHAGVQERALATELEYSIKMAGASRLAYPTMAGGGADTCTIHYGRNDKRVRPKPATALLHVRNRRPRCMSPMPSSCWVCGLAASVAVSVYVVF
jgi:hypothetical protein